MPQFRHLCQVLVCASLATSFATANTGNSVEFVPPLPVPALQMSEVERPTYFEQLWALPIFRLFAPAVDTNVEAVPPAVDEFTLMLPEDPHPGCYVEPLSAIDDAEALAFESQNEGGLGAVDLNGLTPSTQLALANFQRMVSLAGGQVVITSAYRPAAYQEHLREVWEKWMGELRYNRDPLCQMMRAEVQHEFEHHQLLESQRPAVASDHTLGLSFDASVFLPRTKSRKRRISVDALARKAGVHRPYVRRDPVHFRLAI